MNKIEIKPLSVNEAWQGRRFKTKKYKGYEKELLLKLPTKRISKPPYRIEIVFGFSNKMSDIDNPLKPFLDILQKKYGINDREIYELQVKKAITKKQNEYIKYRITEFNI